VDHLPPPAERESLLGALADLVAQAGADTLLTAPLVTADARCFPEPWSPTGGGAWLLARRLLVYAGLGELSLRLDVGAYAEHIRAHDHRGHLHDGGHQGAAAWFAGIEDGECWFGVDAAGLETPDVLVAALAHEVAHAYREAHGLVVADRDEEERLTDLTTIYLGFGVLTTNASYRYRAVATGDLGSWSAHSHLGYLSPQAMSFLLAAHTKLRGEARGDQRAVARALETNQAAFFHAAWRELSRPALLARLSLPADIPAVRVLPAVVIEEPPGHGVEAPGESDVGSNDGRPVFRHEVTMRGALGAAGLVVGGLALLVLHLRGATAVGLALLAVGVVVGPLVGGRRRWDQCASCSATIPAAATRCPGCRGHVVGRIDHPGQRLDAEEQLTDELARRRR
jgi:hypothetical protein